MGSRYAGIDWATEKHDVRVANETGEKLLAATFVHDEAGLSALCRTLVRMEVDLVAIERPDGVLVERLLDAGLRVLPCIQRRSQRPVIGSGSQAGSPITSTPSCCVSWRELTATASGCLSLTQIRPRRCER